jgi:hypothetical protein
MPTQYTSLLGLAKPQTGELSGTWGTTVNDYITDYLDAAVAGAQVISGSQTAVTLSTTNGSALVQAGAAAAGSSQYAIIRCTGNPASMLTITAPATSKTYLVVNATSTNQDVKIVGAGPTTGVIIPPARSGLVFWNGADFQIGPVVGPASSTDNAVVRYDGTTGKVVQNSGVTIDDSNNVAGVAQLSTSGNVGVGTTTPSGASGTALEVNGGAGQARLVLKNNTTGSASTDGSQIALVNSQLVIQNREASEITFETNGAEQMRIDSSGNVGIGLGGAAPQARLHINSGATDEVARFEGTGAPFISLYDSGTRDFYLFDSTEIRLWGQANKAMVFATNNNESMRIDASGNVGIGNTPSVKLDVQGAGTIRGFLTTTDAIKLGANTSAPTTTDAFIYRPANNTLAFGTASTEQARITSAGLLQFNSDYGSVATAYGCRAWVNFNGTGTPARRGNGNVSSIIDYGTGDYGVVFTTNMPDTNYAVNITCNAGASNIDGYAFIRSISTGSVRIATFEYPQASTDASIICVTIFR